MGHSIETRQKISAAMKKYYKSPDAHAKTSSAMKNKPLSKQQLTQLKQLHDAKRGIPRTLKQRNAISVALRGKRWGKGWRVDYDRYVVRIFTGGPAMPGLCGSLNRGQFLMTASFIILTVILSTIA